MKRQGKYISNLKGHMQYKTFKPSNLPISPNIEINIELLSLITEATILLGELKGISKNIPDRSIYISMHVQKEALLSSQIEGTQATLDDLFDPNKRNVNLDVDEVVKYVKAIHKANELLITLPLSNRLLKEIHKVLLSGTRGEDKNPGEFRRSQNWIGSENSTLNTASYIPPNIDDMKEALANLEEFIHNDPLTIDIIKIALVHYQFETIHPFLDGNGRIGRLLINLMLKEYNLLDSDVLYISLYFKRHRREYYDRLMDVRNKGHYEQWVSFFLKAVIDSSKDAINCIQHLLNLDKKNTKLLQEYSSSNKTIFNLYEYIKSNPLLTIKNAATHLNKSYNTVHKAVMALVNLNILKQTNNFSRNKVYIYDDYISILKKGTHK